MKNLRYLILILVCSLFTTPAQAQEGHFGIQQWHDSPAQAPKDETQKAEAAPLVNPAPSTDFSELRSQGVVLIQAVIDPLRVQLQDGRIVQLAGIDIPDNDASNPGPLASAAFTQLQNLLLNKQATLYQTKNENEGRRNRMGHYLGHLETHADKFWVQGFLLKNGLARILPSPEQVEMAPAMIALEDEARTHKRGLWADEKYNVLTPETADKAMNQWAVVEGTITKTGMSNNTIFLNFGEDWRRDFTIGIEGTVRRDMAKRDLNGLNFVGKKVRVRGWVENYNGPYIKLSHAVWLDILPETPPQAKVGAGQ